MTIRSKSLLIILVTLCTIIAVTIMTTQAILRHSSYQLEEQYTGENVDWAQNAIATTLGTMVKTLGDWATWDDTYAFVQNRNPKYIANNLEVDTTYESLSMNMLLFYNRRGTLVYGRYYNLQQHRRMAIPSWVTMTIKTHPGLLTHASIKSTHAGIIRSPAGDFLIASRPILTSQGTGPIVGTLVFGRHLDRSLLRAISSHSRLHLDVYPVHGYLPSDVARANQQLRHGQKTVVDALNHQEIVGYRILNDIDGKPATILRVQRPRSIYQRSVADLWRLLGYLLGIGIVAGALALLLFNREVLSRLTAFTQSVISVGKTGNLAERVAIAGHDELTDVAQAVNGMLSSLEESQRELRQQETLRESEARYRQLVELSPDSVMIFCEERCTFINAAGLQLLRATTREELLDIPLASIVNASEEQLREIVQDPQRTVRHEVEFVRRDGSTVDVELATTGLTYQGKPGIQLVAHDITERKLSAERLNYLAYHDVLTDLPNRLLFKDRLTQAIALAKRYQQMIGVIVLDLDRFKEINDTLGHDIGDALLQSVASRLRDFMRSSDTVARVGGDEFFMLFYRISQRASMEQSAQRIIKLFEQPFVVNEHEIAIVPSIGISCYPDDGETVEALVKNADMAMYQAKACADDAYRFYTIDMSQRMSERRSLENHLRKMIAQEQLIVQYQPQVHLQSGAIIGLEALTRCPHPEQGLISPATFIPLAEERGLIEALDEWVLNTVCRQGAAWQQQGLPPLRIAVNISARSFRQSKLADTMLRIIAKTNIDPQLLEIEITESVMLENKDATLAMLQQLHNHGVRLAIDDFGSGYSSFGYLKRFPIDTLKIDRFFIQDILTDEDSTTIVKAIIGMTHNLKCVSLAEAVETSEQLAMLRALGCDYGQGYLFSHPVDAEQVPRLLMDHRAAILTV